MALALFIVLGGVNGGDLINVLTKSILNGLVLQLVNRNNLDTTNLKKL